MSALAIAAGVAVLALLLLASAFFSGAETAFFSLDAARVQSLGKGSARGRRLAALLAKPTQLLSTILIGNTIVNVAIATLGYRMIAHLESLGPYGPAVAVGAMTVALLLFGEVAPKRLAVAHAGRFALAATDVLEVLERVFAPLRACLEYPASLLRSHLRPERRALDDDELLTAAEVGAEQGVLDRDERSMVDGILRLDEMTASDVMTPRVDFEGVDLDDGTGAVLAAARKTTFRHLPIWRGTPDAVEGFLNVASFLLDPAHDIGKATDFPLFVPETAPLDELLVTMRRHGRRIACVMDEYGGTAGLVTRGDILDIFAEAPPDVDEKPERWIEPAGENRWLIDGDVSLEEINHDLGLSLEAEGADRISGWVAAQMGRIPRIGETVEAQGCRVTVRHRRRLRINEVVLEIIDKGLGEEDVRDDADDGEEERDEP